MSIAEVISRTVGPTASTRRTLEREAARIAGELADADRRRHQLSMQAHDRSSPQPAEREDTQDCPGRRILSAFMISSFR